MDGRMAHQMWLSSGITPERCKGADIFVVILPALEQFGQAGARQLGIGGEPVALQSGSCVNSRMERRPTGR